MKLKGNWLFVFVAIALVLTVAWAGTSQPIGENVNKADQVVTEQLDDFGEGEATPPLGQVIKSGVESRYGGTKAINNVTQSATPSTNFEKSGNDYTKDELSRLLQRARTNKRSLSQKELMLVEDYIQSLEQEKNTLSANNYNGFSDYSRTQILSDDFSYSDGSLVGNGSWVTYSGSTPGQVQVSGGLVLLNDTDSEDVRAEFAPISSGTLYFGVDVQIADPTAYTGTDYEYFVGFSDTSGYSMYGRTDAAAFSASGWSPGIANASGTAEATWAAELSYATTYRIVVGTDISTGISDLWVDPASSSDTKISGTGTTTITELSGLFFRQSSASPDLNITVDNLVVSDSFADVITTTTTNLSEGFEGSTFPPLNWQAISNNTSNSVTQSSSQAHSGTYSARFSSYSSATDYTQYLISPKLTAASGDSIAFWYRKYTYGSEVFSVGVSTTDSDVASFTFGSDVTNASTTWQRYVEDLTSYAGQDIYVAIKYSSIFAYYLYIDDVTGPEPWVDPSPVANLSVNSLNFGYVITSGSGIKTVVLTNSGGSDLTGTIASDATEFSVGTSAISLTSGSSDTISITYSPSAEGAQSGNIIFTHNGASSPDTVAVTGTGTTSLLIEGFENDAWVGDPAAPPGWSQITVSGTNAWYRNSSSYSHSGSYQAKGPWASAGGEHYLITPAIDLGTGAYRLKFWLDGSTSAGTDLYAMLGTANTATSDFTTELASWIAGTNMPSSYTEQVLDLSMYSGIVYLAFRMVDADGYSVYIDDIEIEEIPPTPILDLDYAELAFLPSIIDEAITELGFVVGTNAGSVTMGIDSIVTTNSDFSVAVTAAVRTDSVVAGGDVVVDLSFTATSFGDAMSHVIFYTNALSSPDTMKLTGEASRYYVDFQDWMFPYGWTIIDNDTVNAYGYDDGWILYTSYGPGYAVPYARSHFNVDGSDDWMITQKLSPVAGDSIIFLSNSSSSSILEDTLHVYVSTTDNLMASFTTEIGEVVSQGYTNLRSAFDLGSYAGSDIYVAIVHHGSVGSNYWSYRKVDDIMLPARYASTVPELAVVPDTLDFGMVLPGMAATDSVWIYNAGGVDLVISDISSANAAYTVDVSSATLSAFESMWVDVTFAPTASGDYDATLDITSNSASSPDAVALLGEGSPTSGGPGTGGYTWINSFDAAGPTYSWIDTAGATAHFPGALGDDYRFDVEIPFNFFYYGTLVSNTVMTTNGWVGFNPSYSSSYWTNTEIPSATLPDNMAAPLWDDWKAESAYSYHGTMYTKLVGTAPNRQLVYIFWELVRNSSDTDWYSFEMIIEEGTNNIIFQYYDVDGSGNTGTDASNGIGATVGLEGPEGAVGIEYLYNGDPHLVYDGEAILFIAPPLPPMGAVEGIVTDMAGAPIADAAVELYSANDVFLQMDSTDAAGAYFMEYLSPGLVDLYAFADGFRPSEYIVNIVAEDTITQDVVLAADTAGVSLVWYTGFETTDDSGSVGIFDGDNSFAVVDTFFTGTDTILPTTGSQMLTFPDPDSATAYANDNYAYWMASAAIGLAGRDEGSLLFEVDANYDTESGWDFFYLAVLLDDGYFYVVSEFSGDSDGWIVEGADISWVFDSGSTYFVPMVVFEADASVVGGWGGAFDNARILYDEYFLAPVGDLAATHFQSDVTLTWTSPAARGTVSYDLQRVDLENPHAFASSEGVVALVKGPSPKEKITMSYGYSNDVSRDLLGYKVFKVEGPLADEEDAEMLATVTTTTFNDADVVDGTYYGYGVSVSYDEGDSYVEGVWTRIGAVTQVAPFSEDFEGLSGAIPTGWEAFTTNPDGITWTVGDSAAADSSFNIIGKCPAHTDFAFIEDGTGNEHTFEALLISPFIDASDMYSAVVSFAGYEQGWGTTPTNTTIAEMWVRAELDEWELVTDFSYDHNDGWVNYMGNMADVAGGMEYVQFAFYFFHLSGYSSGGGEGMGIDDFDFFGLAGPTNLTAAGAQGHVELNWSEPSARSRELISGNVVARQITTDRTETGIVPGPIYDNRDVCYSNWLPAGWFTGFYGPDSGYTAPTIATLFEFPNGPMTLEMALHHGIWYFSADPDPWPDTVRAFITVSETDLAGVTRTVIDADTVDYYLESGYYYDAMLDLIGLTYQQTDSSYLKVSVELLDDAYYDQFGANIWMPPLRIDDPNDDINSGLSGYDSAGIFQQDDGYDWFLEICGTPTPPALRYNVYRDDLLLNVEPLEEVTYMDEDVIVLEEHEYFVTGFVPIIPASDNPGLMLFVDTDSSNHAAAAALNTPPSAPSLAVPPDNFTVVVDNLTGAASFAWAPSVETDIGQSVTYDFELTLGTNTWEISTDVTTVSIPYQELYTEIFDNQGVTSLTGTWNATATDGLDDTPASNGPRTITVDVTAVGVDEDAAIPDVFALHQNYPNPFNPTTTIAYDIPEASHVRIDIYNLLGQKICTLVNGEHAPAYYHARWDGTTDAGAIVASGMYIYRIDAGKFSAIRKLVIMK